jgi:hypothetical protein
MWAGFTRLRIDRWRAREHGNEPSGSIKCEEFLDWLSDY